METWNMTAHLRLEEDQNTFVVAEPSPRFVARETRKRGRVPESYTCIASRQIGSVSVSNCHPL